MSTNAGGLERDPHSHPRHIPARNQDNSSQASNIPRPYPFGTGAYSKEHLDYTIKTFQPHYKKPLTYEDAAEIVFNILHLYEVLKQGYNAQNIREKTT
jgi:hypothetical protein